MRDVVIVGGARTPQGRLLGQLASMKAVDLGAHAIRSALARAGVEAEAVQYVLMGHVIQAGCGQNPAKQAAVSAGLGMHVPAETVNKVCLSGLAAVTHAARLIRLGEAEVVVAGGMESMTNAPHLARVRAGVKYGTAPLEDAVAADGLDDAADRISMGLLTEQGNERHGFTREEQDAVAADSHVRAARAAADGIFADEIAPVSIPQRRGEPLVLDSDEGVRAESTVETLGKLRPAFRSDGTITAGNASPISDGAAALVVTSREYAEANGLTVLCVVGEAGQVAGPDTQLHEQPSKALAAALARAGWEVADLDFLEINEAFAAVGLASLKELGYPWERTNLHGGAIALGHPVGASGARLALHAAMELHRRGAGRAGVALCGGGGQGEALLLSANS
ncbi:acetyl-CoA C-acetyltransferase [Tessaracoccus sp. MC1756]|uniref:acetyl-CoA C-acetyltransferase n=1 Tax=Tessaracoccus sp. MC1756 TaxID=2760311 RepID=UPI0015FED449|nr:acetyl-CoA C-acetyltransferase [Tessaracoccus sp. MC1756]MBB1510412.1 acetyl-CoA C-acetyltransferase [Tessaracoccus sp. MC1756]